MKKIITTIVALTALNVAFAQVETVPGTTTVDTTTVRVGKKKFSFSEKGIDVTDSGKRAKADDQWSGLGIGLNLLTTSDGNINLAFADRNWENEPIKSMTWNLNFYGAFIPITRDRHTFGLETGLGLTYRSFGLENNELDIVADNDETTLIENPDGLKYDKNKFRATYISVPALIAFNSSLTSKNNFHFSAGVIGNLRIGSIYKQKYDKDGETNRVKTRDDFNLSPLTLDATARIGYAGVTFFFNYGLTSLFKEGQGPDVIPMTFGVAF